MFLRSTITCLNRAVSKCDGPPTFAARETAILEEGRTVSVYWKSRSVVSFRACPKPGTGRDCHCTETVRRCSKVAAVLAADRRRTHCTHTHYTHTHTIYYRHTHAHAHIHISAYGTYPVCFILIFKLIPISIRVFAYVKFRTLFTYSMISHRTHAHIRLIKYSIT